MSATPVMAKWFVLVCTHCGRTLTTQRSKDGFPDHRCTAGKIRAFDVEVPLKVRVPR